MKLQAILLSVIFFTFTACNQGKKQEKDAGKEGIAETEDVDKPIDEKEKSYRQGLQRYQGECL